MGSARSVAAGSAVSAVAPGSAMASMLWPCERADGASVSPFVALRVAPIEVGVVYLVLPPKGGMWCWRAVYGPTHQPSCQLHMTHCQERK